MAFFSETLRKEAPAHVAFCIRWLSPKDFCLFEEKHRKWQEWLRIGKKCGNREADPTCDLIQFLKELVDCEWDPKELGGEPDCQCIPKEKTESDIKHEPNCKQLFKPATDQEPIPGTPNVTITEGASQPITEVLPQQPAALVTADASTDDQGTNENAADLNQDVFNKAAALPNAIGANCAINAPFRCCLE